MLITPQTLEELHTAIQTSPGGFVVVDSGLPRFAVLDYETFQLLKKQKSLVKKGKILVTGGCGYIGSHTVKVLQDLGYEVVVFDNLSTGRKEAVRGDELIVGDLKDAKTLDQVFAENKFDAVIHFAASIDAEESVNNPSKYFRNNVINGLNLLNTMIKHSVSKIVFSSTAAVYGDTLEFPITESTRCKPINPYGESKLMFEKILRWYSKGHGIHSVSLRYFNAAGAWPDASLGLNHVGGGESHLIPRILKVALGETPEVKIFGQDYPTPDGTCIRDYVHVLDLAEAHVTALQKLENANGAYVYNVGTGRGYSVLEVIDEAVEVTGKMIPISVGTRRKGDPTSLVADSSKLRGEFGWRPRFGLKDILQSSWEWLKKTKYLA